MISQGLYSGVKNPQNVCFAIDFPDGLGSDIAKLLTHEDDGKRPSRSEAITSSTSSQSHYQSRSQSDNIRVGDLVLGEMEIFLDGYCQQWRKSIPGPKGDEERPPREQEDPAIDIERVENWD